MKMIMVVPKSAWGKEDEEIEEIIAKERAEMAEMAERRKTTEEEDQMKVSIAIPSVVKSLKDIAFTIVDKKLEIVKNKLPEDCCLRPKNCIFLKRKETRPEPTTTAN